MKQVLALSLVAMLFAETAGARPAVQLQGTTDAFTPIGCLFPEDHVILSISDNGKHLASKTYCTTFGKSTAKLVTDTRGVTYLLLEYGVGRGTNATEYFLDVDRLEGDLKQVFKKLISTATGPSSRYRYEYKAQTPKTGGLTLTLTLRA